ncbi:MAG: tetratricopeptide repeat protein, partial [bacterium]
TGRGGPGGRAAGARALGAAPGLLALLFALGAAGPLALSGARNFIVSGDRVLITHHGGISFYMGNNETTDGTYRPPPYFQGTPEAIDQRDSKRFAEMDAGRELKMSEVEGYWYRKAFAFVREKPGQYAALVARKFALYWGNYEIPLNASWDFFKRYSPILLGAALSFGIIVPLACVGAWSVVRGGGGGASSGGNGDASGTTSGERARPATNSRRAIFPALFILANMAAVVGFFVCDRYRLPAAPFLIVFAAVGVERIAAFARARAARPLAICLVVVAALAALLNVRVTGNPSLSFARSHVAVGQSALRRGDRPSAERAFRDAIIENRYYLDAYMNLGTLYQQDGKIDSAIETYDALLATNPDFAGAYLNRGACRQAKGDLEGALADYTRAEELDPFLPAASNNVGYALQTLGRSPDAAEAAYRRALAKDATLVDTRANLARLLEATGRPDAAIAEYEALVKLLDRSDGANGPAIAAIESRFGDLLIAKSRFAEAEPHYRRALALGPPNPDLLIHYGITLSNMNRANEALQILQRAVKDHPLDEEVSWRVANIFLDWGDAATAAIVFERAARNFAENPRYSYGAAVAHTRAKDLDRARAALAEAIRRGGESIRAAAARDGRLAAIRSGGKS